MPDPLEDHYRTIIKAITDGRVVPFFGAGVNRCGRPDGEKWQRGRYLPDGGELSSHLADKFYYPSVDKQDLVRVSQYITVMTGSGPLYEELHSLFDVDYPLTPLHRLFATLPNVLRKMGIPKPCQLVVTTNYDDTMERAFKEAGEPFDVVAFMTEGEERGKFRHWLPNGEVRLIERPNEYKDLAVDQRPIILKIHGAIDRMNPNWDSFVITEDHYIDYLTRTDISQLLPVQVAAKLKRSHFLFLGYSLRDWNLRVILHRIWGEQKLNYKSWAIQLNPDQLETKFWSRREVDIIPMRLEDYVDSLGQRLPPRPPA